MDARVQKNRTPAVIGAGAGTCGINSFGDKCTNICVASYFIRSLLEVLGYLRS